MRKHDIMNTYIWSASKATAFVASTIDEGG
jgi:hypothetical protein